MCQHSVRSAARLLAIPLSLVFAGAMSGVTSAASASTVTVASCRARGDFATCIAGGTARHDPHTIRVYVNATPNQKVLVSWDMVCSKGSGAGSKSGQFTQRTPVNRILPKPYTYPSQCTLSAEAQLNVGGTLHLWLTRNS